MGSLSVLDMIGWAGSALLIYSILEARVMRFRVLNLLASVVLTGFNLALGIWPMVAMNAVLAGINLWHIVKLTREHVRARNYSVLRLQPEDPYLQWLIHQNLADIQKHHPGFQPAAFTHPPGTQRAERRMAALIVSDHETVGMLLGHVDESDEKTLHVVVDYVFSQFRDFSPGLALYRPTGFLSQLGVRRVIANPSMAKSGAYLRRMGFVGVAGSQELEIV